MKYVYFLLVFFYATIGVSYTILFARSILCAAVAVAPISLIVLSHGGDNVEAHNHNRHNEDIQYIYHPIRSRMIILPIITLLNFAH